MQPKLFDSNSVDLNVIRQLPLRYYACVTYRAANWSAGTALELLANFKKVYWCSVRSKTLHNIPTDFG